MDIRIIPYHIITFCVRESSLKILRREISLRNRNGSDMYYAGATFSASSSYGGENSVFLNCGEER